MTGDQTNLDSELVPVSALDQFLYCPRRYWYYRFFNPTDRSESLVEGRAHHRSQSRRPGWVRERYLRSEELGLHGRVDLLDESQQAAGTSKGQPNPIPVERKRASSGRVYRNDEIQVSAYGLLVENAIESINTVEYGIVYLYETDERHKIPLTEERRCAVREIRDSIRRLQPDEPPAIVDNRNKCDGCSVRHCCQPETEAYVKRHADDIVPHRGG